MTEPELHALLRRLADHLATLHEDLETDGLHAARQSQTGVRSNTTGSRPPCNLTDLDYLTTDEEREDKPSPRVIIRGWCTELQRTAGITEYPAGKPLNVMVAWLARNRRVLLDQDWAEDAVAELRELEAQLRHRLYPQDPAAKDWSLTASELPDRATEDQLCTALGVKPGTIRAWKSKGKIRDAGPTRVIIHGEARHVPTFMRADGLPWTQNRRS